MKVNHTLCKCDIAYVSNSMLLLTLHLQTEHYSFFRIFCTKPIGKAVNNEDLQLPHKLDNEAVFRQLTKEKTSL